MSALAISPLSLNQLTRDLWGQYDSSIIAQLAPLANEDCYAPKFYKAPSTDQELIAANGYVPYGMKITPGSIIFGLYLPCDVDVVNPFLSLPPKFNVQITDQALEHQWFSDPLASYFLSNYKPCYQSTFLQRTGSFPNLLTAPYPVVGEGLFMVEIQNTLNEIQRLQLVFGVLEVC